MVPNGVWDTLLSLAAKEAQTPLSSAKRLHSPSPVPRRLHVRLAFKIMRCNWYGPPSLHNFTGIIYETSEKQDHTINSNKDLSINKKNKHVVLSFREKSSMFRNFLIFSLVIFLISGEVCAWGRFRKAFDKVKKRAEKAREIFDSIQQILDIIGKRSVDKDMSRFDICNFSSLDLNIDDTVSESEISTLIEMTGKTELASYFQQLDINKDNKVTEREYQDSDIITNICP
ncbi:uncharacterized protein LOC134256473 [Saccostrea cucullata]|uniref:uncharacterized protein LOC134256473 n=1 Tax=Saccostrea cuccullata TaxID=36930 RepID=UPI002ED4E41D